MKSVFINVFNSDRPTLICTHNSYVVAGNDVAVKKLQRLFEKEKLFEYMCSLDIIRFEAAASAGEPLPFEFPLSSYHGYTWAMAVPEKLGARTLVAVNLFKNEEEARLAIDLDKNSDSDYLSQRLHEFVHEFSRIDSSAFDIEENNKMFDIKAITKQLINDMNNETEVFDCDVIFSQNKEMEDTPCMPSQISLPNYIKMIVAMMYVMNDITNHRRVSIRLCRYGDIADIRMTTDAKELVCAINSINAFIENFPSSVLRLSVCEFIAGQTGCTLTATSSLEESSVTLSLLMTTPLEGEVDFKSSNQMDGYKNIFRETVQSLSDL